MQIKNILELSGMRLEKGDPKQTVNYIWGDSRKIEKDDIFLVSSTLVDFSYLLDAKKRGSRVCILSEDSSFLEKALLEYENVILTKGKAELIQGYIASLLLGHPSRSMKVFAVTGTNGKTTMTHLLYHFSVSLGKRSGIIGTLHAKFGDQILETGYTTPDSSTLQLLLRKMLDEGVEYVFMEASSHGLKLGRTKGLDIFCAVFTNLTRDHMDFHPTMEDYLRSKFELFHLLEKSSHPERFGIVSADSPGGRDVENLLIENNMQDRVFFLGEGRDFEYKNVNLRIDGTEFRFMVHKKDSTFSTSLKIQTNLLGGFNVTNLSLAIAAWMKANIDIQKIPDVCNHIPKVPGRFDIYYSKNRKKLVVVDYAHTPDALENILKSCRAMNPTQLVCIFGCGGDRDRTKRPEMAKIAQEYSDFVIVTSDNPRTEDPQIILDEIEVGFGNGFNAYEKILDRRVAIQRGVAMVEDGGIIALCGKGHENYQIIGKVKTHFDDGEEVLLALQNI